jgi:uncharacterized protein
MSAMTFIDNPWFYLFGAFAVLLAGISKAGTGTGLGGLAVPLMTLAIPAPQAAAIMLPVLLAIDAFTLWKFRGKFDKPLLKQLLPAGLLGILIGTLLFKHVDGNLVRLLIGIEAVTFATIRLASLQKFNLAEPTKRSGPKAWLWITMAGFTSFIGHAGGPPYQQYVVPLKLDKVIFVGTATIFFSVMNFAKLLPYGYLGLLDLRNIGTSIVLMPLIPVGVYIGLNVLKKLNQETFNLVMTLSLLIVGLKLMFDGAMAYL